MGELVDSGEGVAGASDPSGFFPILRLRAVLVWRYGYTMELVALRLRQEKMASARDRLARSSGSSAVVKKG